MFTLTPTRYEVTGLGFLLAEERVGERIGSRFIRHTKLINSSAPDSAAWTCGRSPSSAGRASSTSLGIVDS